MNVVKSKRKPLYIFRHKNLDPGTASAQKGRNPEFGDNPDPELLIGSGYLGLDEMKPEIRSNIMLTAEE